MSSRVQAINSITHKFFDKARGELDVTDPKSVLHHAAPLVFAAAKKLPRPASWELDDLMQVGLMAVLVAAHKFDVEKGSWGGFAYKTSRFAMINATTENQSLVKRHSSTISRQKSAGVAVQLLDSARIDVDELATSCGASAMEASAELGLAKKQMQPKVLEIFARRAAGEEFREMAPAVGLSHQRIEHIVNIEGAFFRPKVERKGKNLEFVARVLESRRAGMTLAAIAALLKTTTKTVHRTLKNAAKNTVAGDVRESATAAGKVASSGGAPVPRRPAGKRRAKAGGQDLADRHAAQKRNAAGKPSRSR